MAYDSGTINVLACDGDDCTNNFRVEDIDRIEIALAAIRDGWTLTESNHLCPDCSATKTE